MVVTMWFDLHMTAKSISDLNNICFVIDVYAQEHSVWQWLINIGYRPYDPLVNPACC